MSVSQPAESTRAEELPFFVYGTLRVGQGNYLRLVAGKTTRSVPAVLPHHRMYAAIYPCITEDAAGGQVVGDLLYIKPDLYDEVLAALDDLEQYHPDEEDPWYIRVKRTVEVTDPDGRIRHVETWVYLGGRATLAAYTEEQRVPSGDWVAHRRATR
jgi:gamma-glutamylcyclotransferase (GGCT)/AIG2-like uncharacterized protein YtfP